MNQTEYANSTPRGCQTCLFRKDGIYSYPKWWQCGRYGMDCHTVLNHNLCRDFSGWRPKPPRRSLRQWLHDTLWA